MIKKIILILIIFGLGYMRGYGDGPIQEKILRETIEQNLTKYYVNETVCIRYETVNETKYTFIPKIETITLNITESQKKKIMNMRPHNCEGIACSFGYVLAKYDCMDVFNLPHPRFSEKPSIQYDPQYENKEYYPIYFDDFQNRYVNFPYSTWIIKDIGNESGTITIKEK